MNLKKKVKHNKIKIDKTCKVYIFLICSYLRTSRHKPIEHLLESKKPNQFGRIRDK